MDLKDINEATFQRELERVPDGPARQRLAAEFHGCKSADERVALFLRIKGTANYSTKLGPTHHSK